MHIVINWLWQTALIVLVVGLALAPLRWMSAAMRYAVWGITLALVLAMPLLALFEPESSPWRASAVVGGGALDAPRAFALPLLPELPAWVTFVALCLWIEWVAFSAVRLARAGSALADTRRACRSFPDDRARRLPLWQRLGRGGRPVTLALSSRVRGAAVLGVRRPIIAISPALASELTDEELDQVIVHELAHVRRRDDLAALGQALVDVVAGFHPAVRAVQARLHREREMACDDWVVRATGSAKRYATCLTRVAMAQGPGVELLAPAALAPAQLTLRIMRLLDRRCSRGRASHMGLMSAVTALVALALVVGAYPLESSTPLPSNLQALAPVSVPAAWPVSTHERPLVLDVGTTGGDVRPAGARRVARPAGVRARALDGSQTRPTSPVEPVAPLEAGVRPDGVAPPVTVDALGLSKIDEAYPEAIEPSSPSDEPALPSVLTAAWRGPAEAGAVVGHSTASTGVAIGEGSAQIGVAIGQGSQKAAAATAGFFSRIGKSIGRVF